MYSCIVSSRVGAIVLISEMQKAEAQNLRKRVTELELDYSNMVDAGYDGILIHFNAIIVEANEAFASMIECSREETIGLNAFELYPPESIKTIMQKLKEGAEEPYEVAGITRKGNAILVSVWGKNFQMGEMTGRVIATKKIKDLKS